MKRLIYILVFVPFALFGQINSSIGSETDGGVLFYLSEDSTRGIVAGDFFELSIRINQHDFNHSNNRFIGWGKQNTTNFIYENFGTWDFNESLFYHIEQNNFAGYTDWVLPSIDELELMVNNLSDLPDGIYISSSKHQNNFNGYTQTYGIELTTGEYITIPVYDEYKSRSIRYIGSWTEGCIDENACNYNSNANLANASLCKYKNQGYDCNGEIQAEVGDNVFGGKVFYINETGDKGLVMFSDIKDEPWGCINQFSSENSESSLLSFKYNTYNIIDNCQGNSAAYHVVNYHYNGYSDWCLPSIEELELIFSTVEVNDLSHPYWSSTEYSESMAYAYHPEQSAYTELKSELLYVIPIRAFGDWKFGCNDSSSCNYIQEPEIVDNSLCIYPNELDCDDFLNYGCTDILYSEYNLEANHDDGSCEIFLSDALDSLTSEFEELSADATTSLSSLQQVLDTWNTSIDLEEGWNMFGYGCPTSIDVVEALSSYNESIIIVKDNNGSIYWPEIGYDGIGDFTPGFGYQIKVSEVIEGFSLCDWYVNDIPEDNIISLQEENASLQAFVDSVSAPLIYQIGTYAHGGIVFFIDSTGQHGLVAGAQFPGEHIYCADVLDDGAFGTELYSGYDNTLDIVNSCSDENAAIICFSHDDFIYDDWYLPSIIELYLIWSNIGPLTEFMNYSLETYWSSTNAAGYNDARMLSFTSGIYNLNSSSASNQGSIANVIPIRSF